MDISASDNIALQALRARVSDVISSYYDTDFNLLRWLQGYNFDLEAVVPKLRHHLRFRAASWKMDDLPKERDVMQKQCWVWGLTGQTGKGDNRLVFVEQSGREDVVGYMKSYSGTQLLYGKIFETERLHRAVMELENETGKQASVVYIMDLQGLKFDTHLLGILNGPLKSLGAIISDHFVEMHSDIVVVNAPAFMYQIWKIVRHILPEKTRNKVQILGPHWRTEILDYASPEALPSFWNKPPEHTNFSADLPVLGKLNESLYQKNPKLQSDNIHTLWIAAGKSETVNIIVEEEKTKLRFGVHASGDFGFGLFFARDPEETDPEKLEMAFPQFKKLGGPTAVPFKDELICDKKGCYKMWFSNAHAWWSSLKIEYYIEL